MAVCSFLRSRGTCNTKCKVHLPHRAMHEVCVHSQQDSTYPITQSQVTIVSHCTASSLVRFTLHVRGWCTAPATTTFFITPAAHFKPVPVVLARRDSGARKRRALRAQFRKQSQLCNVACRQLQ